MQLVSPWRWAYKDQLHSGEESLAAALAAAASELSPPVYFVADDSVLSLSWVESLPSGAVATRRHYHLGPAQPARLETAAADFAELWPSGFIVSEALDSAEEQSRRQQAEALLLSALRSIAARLWPEATARRRRSA